MAAQNASSGDVFDLRPRGARLHHTQFPPWYATNDSIAFAGACPNTTRMTARQREFAPIIPAKWLVVGRRSWAVENGASPGTSRAMQTVQGPDQPCADQHANGHDQISPWVGSCAGLCKAAVRR